MSAKPIIPKAAHGSERFSDFLPLIADFQRKEPDVVGMLGVFANYINNAYRNINESTTFRFILICPDNELVNNKKRLNQLRELLRFSSERGLPIKLLSMPRGNPLNPSAPYCSARLSLPGEYSTYLNPENAINAELIRSFDFDLISNGDCVFIKFIDDMPHTGYYIYARENRTLSPDPDFTSQDPFHDTPNAEMTSVHGWSPRMLSFMASDIGDMITTAANDAEKSMFQISFPITISEVRNEASVTENEYRELVDYYGIVDLLPEQYRGYYSIKFAKGCNDFSWQRQHNQAIFYARDLTDSAVFASKENWVDAAKDKNHTMSRIAKIEYRMNGTAFVHTWGNHGLSEGDYVSIEGTERFNVRNTRVAGIIDPCKAFIESDGSGTEHNVGTMTRHNLKHTYLRDDAMRSYFKVEYDKRWGNHAFATGDIIYRARLERDEHACEFMPSSIDVPSQTIGVSDAGGLLPGDWLLPMDSIPGFPSDFPLRALNPVQINAVDGQRIRLAHCRFDERSSIEDAIVLKKLSSRYISTLDIERDKDYLIDIHDVDGLSEGDWVIMNPLTEGNLFDTSGAYQIEHIEPSASKVRFKGVRFSDARLNDHIPQWLNVVRYEKMADVHGKLEGADGKTIKLDSKSGDVYSRGYFTLPDSSALIRSTSTAVPYGENVGKAVESGERFVEGGWVYECIDDHILGDHLFVEDSWFKDVTELYLIPYKIPEYNPYMSRIFTIKPLDYDEQPDYTLNLGVLSNTIWVRKEDDNRLKFGVETNDKIYNIQRGTNEIAERAGFMTMRNHDRIRAMYDTWLNGIAYGQMNMDTTTGYALRVHSAYIRSNMMNINLLEPHGLHDGDTLTLINVKADGRDLSGRYAINAQGSYRIDIDVTASDTAINISDSVFRYDSAIIQDIVNIYPVGNMEAMAETAKPHGFGTGTVVTISGVAGDEHKMYNRTAEVTRVSELAFTYYIGANTQQAPADIYGVTAAKYTKEGDYIKLTANDEENGYYKISKGAWLKLNENLLSENAVVFAKRNMFTIDGVNPDIPLVDEARIDKIIYNGNHTVTVHTAAPHRFAIGDAVHISGYIDKAFTGIYTISNVIGEYMFIYNVPESYNPPGEGRPFDNRDPYAAKEGYYRYVLEGIGDQHIVKRQPSTYGTRITTFRINSRGLMDISTMTPHGARAGDNIFISDNPEMAGNYEVISVVSPLCVSVHSRYSQPTQGGRLYKGAWMRPSLLDNNLRSLYGEQTVTIDGKRIALLSHGDICLLEDQAVPSENGWWAVNRNTTWGRIQDSISLSVEKISISHMNNPDAIDDGIDKKYIAYTDIEARAYLDENFRIDGNVIILDKWEACEWLFPNEYVSGINSANDPMLQYSAKKDYNSVAPRDIMTADFKGVPDMEYPLAEKFERLAFLKDPNVLDFRMIGYLARMMGYDISFNFDDIALNGRYQTHEDAELAFRRSIMQYPQFAAIKGTETSIEVVLATFGLVGEIITRWTDANDPYSEFVDADMVDSHYRDRGNDLETPKPLTLIPTPHFRVRVEIEGVQDNRIVTDSLTGMIKSIKRIKPINTVFDGIIQVVRAKMNLRIGIGGVREKGRDVAYAGYSGFYRPYPNDWTRPDTGTDENKVFYEADISDSHAPKCEQQFRIKRKIGG